MFNNALVGARDGDAGFHPSISAMISTVKAEGAEDTHVVPDVGG